MSAPARVTLQLCGALTGEVFKGGVLDSRVQPMETETGDVAELPDYPLSHRVVGRARMVSDTGSAPGKPLQHPHRQRITESLIQVCPVIQQRPLTFPVFQWPGPRRRARSGSRPRCRRLWPRSPARCGSRSRKSWSAPPPSPTPSPLGCPIGDVVESVELRCLAILSTPGQGGKNGGKIQA